MERIFAQGISFMVSIVLARILVPEDFGVVSMVTIFFTLANVLISGGLNTALIQKKNADREDYSTVFTVSLLMGIFLYGLLFFMAPRIAKIYRQPGLTAIIRVMGLSLPVYAIKSIVCAYTSATLQFKKFFFATLGGTLFSGMLGIAMALRGMGAWALVAQQMSNTVIDTVILYSVTRLKIRLMISWQRLKGLFSYGWKILVSTLMGTVYSQVNPLIIGLRFSSADLSFYTKGASFPDVLSTSMISTLSSVLFPVLSKFQDDREQLLRGTRQFMQTVSYLIFPMMFGLFAVADNFVLALLTEKWLPAAYYIRIFCFQGMFDITSIGNCETIKAMGRSDVYLKIEIIKKVLYFITLALFIWLSPSPEVLAWSVVVVTVIALVVNVIPNIRLIGYSIRMQIADLLPNFLLSGLMCLGVMGVGMLPLPAALLLILQILTGMGTYVAMSLVTKNKNFRFLLDSLRSIRRKTEA